MPDATSPYRSSIWDQDGRYSVDPISLNEEGIKTISRLMSVDAAKKNTPPIPLAGLLIISALAKAMPQSELATAHDVIGFISSTKKIYGAGIPTAICMLAVETDGDYPPIDRKFSAGMLKCGVINDVELASLSGSNGTKFAKIYVEKVIPAWKASLKGRTVKEADNYWGRGGKD